MLSHHSLWFHQWLFFVEVEVAPLILPPLDPERQAKRLRKQSQQGGGLSKNLTKHRPKKDNSRKAAVWQRFVESEELRPVKAECLRK